MGRPPPRPATLDELVDRFDRHVRLTNRRLGQLEKLTLANSPNGALTEIRARLDANGEVLCRLEPLADAASDLAELAQHHADEREVARAQAILEASSERARQRRQRELEREWLYRASVRARRVLERVGGRFWYAVVGAAGLYLVDQAWRGAGLALPHLLRLP